ncbi:MAG: ABC transporter ATP-binding protein [Oscillospiraceae bacterium]|jgi:putative ABC transport system ATP-binding protein|nr:ABC transporter ATP-binding protein [Oscillospiraceae bacterium]
MIQLEGINKIYGNRESQVQALKDVSLKILEGEMLSIIGKSGSGKSTLLNILGGLDKCTSGKYTFDSSEVSAFSDRQLADFRCEKIGFVVQNFALINDVSVFENVALPLKYAGKSKQDISKRVREVLSELDILDKESVCPSELSGGQCQRTAIARAIVCKPKLILADEPTGALDEETGTIIMELFKKLNKDGITIVIVTHDMEISNSCNKTIQMKDGRLV